LNSIALFFFPFSSIIIIISSARVRFSFSSFVVVAFFSVEKGQSTIVCPYMLSFCLCLFVFFAIITTDDGYCENKSKVDDKT